jgi:DNA-binding FadR family transcriptional regulator
MLISQLSEHWGQADVLRDIHLELVNLIREGAADAAEAAARTHVENAFQRNVRVSNFVLGKTLPPGWDRGSA